MNEPTTSTPGPELDRRVADFQRHLRKAAIDGALILQNADRYYFSGTIQQAHLYIPAEGAPLLMVRRSLERARAESALPGLVPLKSPRQVPDLLAAHDLPMPRRLGLELDVLPAALYLTYQELFTGAEIVDISPAVRSVRAVKSEYELTILREAARGADAVAAAVPDFLEAGITEIELAGRIEAEARRLGHQGIVRMRMWGNELFYGHVMAGDAAAVPSYLQSPTGGLGPGAATAQGAGFRPIGRNEPILVDYVFALKGYLADHTRIFSMGDLPDDLMAAHEAMLKVQDVVAAVAAPGVAAGELYERACREAADLGHAEAFMGTGKNRIRFVGHGIGLELDEFPFLAKGQKMPLSEGMVIALEPKLVLPGRGVVGIENSWYLTANGLERLTTRGDAVTTVSPS